MNAALDATDLVAQLRACHAKAQALQNRGKLEEKYKWYGLNLTEGSVCDNLNAGVLEATISKIKCIKFATEAAITILRIDDLITMTSEKNVTEDDDN